MKGEQATRYHYQNRSTTSNTLGLRVRLCVYTPTRNIGDPLSFEPVVVTVLNITQSRIAVDLYLDRQLEPELELLKLVDHCGVVYAVIILMIFQ